MQLFKQQMDELFLKLSFDIRPVSGFQILTAELSCLGFEMFEENQSGLMAYNKDSEYKGRNNWVASSYNYK